MSLNLDAPVGACFPTWKTITLGLYKSKTEYEDAFKKAKNYIQLYEWGHVVLCSVTCSQKKVDLELVVLSLSDLGFEESASYRDILAKAAELGLKRCPAEVGPALRLQYTDQPRGERLLIAMELVGHNRGFRRLFCVGQSTDFPWLDACHGISDHIWYPGISFVFVR